MAQGPFLYTKRQLAEVLQVCERTVGRMMHRGDISYLKINGRLVRFRREEVLRELAETSLVRKDGSDKEEKGVDATISTPHPGHQRTEDSDQ